MKISALLQAGLLTLTCSFLASPASAAVIFVANSSFEILPGGGLPTSCGTNCSLSLGAIPGWTTVGSGTGQWQPGAPINTNYFNTLSDGPTSAFSNSGTISQIVAPTVQEHVIYTLLVDIGTRKSQPGLGVATLLIGGTPIIATGGVFVPGSFSTFTATYVGVAADVGKTIEIRLSTTGTQGNFDNVRLTGEPTPEPSTMGLLGLGLAALGLARRKFLS